ncbi:hypothetical protein ACOJBO_01845 [Rhizobium beringeri]
MEKIILIYTQGDRIPRRRLPYGIGKVALSVFVIAQPKASVAAT